MPKDIIDQDLVYVPRMRKSTVERLIEEGFVIEGIITFKTQDLDGLRDIEMVCMTRKH